VSQRSDTVLRSRNQPAKAAFFAETLGGGANDFRLVHVQSLSLSAIAVKAPSQSRGRHFSTAAQSWLVLPCHGFVQLLMSAWGLIRLGADMISATIGKEPRNSRR